MRTGVGPFGRRLTATEFAVSIRTPYSCASFPQVTSGCNSCLYSVATAVTEAAPNVTAINRIQRNISAIAVDADLAIQQREA